MTGRLYVAGALFTPAQRRRLEEIDEICRTAGFDTYLPHRDAGLADPEDAANEVFDDDVAAIDESTHLLAVLEGPPFDSGTAWELGYAHADGLPAVGLVEDERIFDPERQLNPMLLGSLSEIVQSPDELETFLRGWTA